MNGDLVSEEGGVFVGTTITLPKAGGSRPGASRREPASSTRTYTVKKGDTLSQIAQREVGSVRYLDEIRDLNPSLRDGKDRIMVGQELVLPARSGVAQASR